MTRSARIDNHNDGRRHVEDPASDRQANQVSGLAETRQRPCATLSRVPVGNQNDRPSTAASNAPAFGLTAATLPEADEGDSRRAEHRYRLPADVHELPLPPGRRCRRSLHMSTMPPP